jgi:hypothetical protein
MTKLPKYQKGILIATGAVCALALTSGAVDVMVTPSSSTSTPAAAITENGSYIVPFPAYPSGEYSVTMASNSVFQCAADGKDYQEEIVPLMYDNNPATIHTFTNLEECENQAALDQWGSS